MIQKIFKEFDFSDFWDDSEYSLEEYTDESPSNELINSIEQEIGYKLPASYIELMQLHNGGTPKNCCFPAEGTTWAPTHCAITGIFGIGRNKRYSLCGELGSQFMIDEWGYPDTGIFICDCPSGGHDMIMLDYSKCGKDGEPEVFHVDQEYDYKKTFLAKDFETFIRGLVSPYVYDTSAQDLINTLENFKTGRFSDTLQQYFSEERNINFDKILRNLFTELTVEKGHFGLHADTQSYLAYDIQFYLLTLNKKITTKQEFVKDYPMMVALGNNEISTGGYYGDFFSDWYEKRVISNDIIKGSLGELKFSDKYKNHLFDKLKQYE